MEVKIIRKEIIALGVIIAIILLICSPANAEEDLENLTTKNTPEPIIITENNFQEYFDDKNSLNSSFENKTVVLEGEFDDLGVVNIDAKNVIPKKLNTKQKELLNEFAEVSGEEIKHVEKGLKDKFKEVFN
ncbi:hypothetical protein [uncultured Methanobrevibacter sp.]|uniref:hypothetical protein n=1 Tax=uncultured Methanobrevibacter sp. TaxID=253161 RepID=UPI0025CCC9BE|nr:hypothetical protein [uncultured Methanobrevibacter sp.]